MQVERKTGGMALFNDDRDLVQEWLVDVIEEEYQNSMLKEMILPFFANPKGKKLRPLLNLNMFRTIHGEEFNEDLRYKLKHLSSAVEISHNASLMIDDVFDKDIVRRGEPAFHVEFSTFAALSAGYNLSAFVFDLATRTDNHQIVRELGKVGTALSSALFMSKDLVSKKRISRDFFMDLLFRKTSALFVTSTKTAALLATEDKEIINAATKFGEYYGTAYQLRDDVLAIIGDKKDLGKEPYSDIVNRFQSLITIEAMDQSEGDDLQILNEFYLQKKDYPVELIRDILIKTGAVTRAATITKNYISKAESSLEMFDMSSSKEKLLRLLAMINFDKYDELLFS